MASIARQGASPASRKGGRPKAPVVTLEVTRTIIEASRQQDSRHCMIATAVKMAVPNARFVSVDVQTIRFTDPVKRLRYTYLTPRVAQVALVNFDMGDLPEPFTVRLSAGHVGRAMTRTRRKAGEVKPGTEAQSEAGRVNVHHAQLAQAKLVIRSGRNGAVPERNGGSPPPVIPGGFRREFGLRSFERRLPPPPAEAGAS